MGVVTALVSASVDGNAAMAEWLRRLTRNQMGSSRVGSNPTRSDMPDSHGVNSDCVIPQAQACSEDGCDVDGGCRI